jgi:hypothetical protein
LTFKENVVHPPEVSLRVGSFGGLDRMSGERMNVDQRKIAKGEK